MSGGAARRKHLGLGVVLDVAICLPPDGPARAASPRCDQVAVAPSIALGYCFYPGSGPLLVLLSGLGDDLRSWSPPFLKALNRLAAVLIYDRRGYGQGGALSPQTITAQAVSADLHQLLRTLQISQPVVLVGHSLGGLYAQYFARNYPQQGGGGRADRCRQSLRAGR